MALTDLFTAIARGVNLPLIVVITLGVIPLGDNVVEMLWFPPAWRKMLLLLAGAVALASYARFRRVCQRMDEREAKVRKLTRGQPPQATLDPDEYKALKTTEPEDLQYACDDLPGESPWAEFWRRRNESYWTWLAAGVTLIIAYVVVWHLWTIPRPDQGPLATTQPATEPTDAGYGSDRLILPLWYPHELRATLDAEGGWSGLIDSGGYLVKDLLEEDYRLHVAGTTVVFLLLTVGIVYALTGAGALAMRSCGDPSDGDAIGEGISKFVEFVRNIGRKR